MSQGIGELITRLAASVRKLFRLFMERGRHKWTIMIIPHTEHESRNFRVSNFVLYGFLGFLSLSVLTAGLYMIDFTVRFKDLLRLQRAKDVEAINTKIYKEELATFQKRIKPYQGQAANLATRVPNTGLRFNGIGGRELSLDELSASLKSYLENSPGKAMKNSAGLEGYTDFFRDTADVTEQLGLFIQKRKAFMNTLPTLWPVEGGLGQVARKPGEAATLRLPLAPGTAIRSGADGTVVLVDRLNEKKGLLRIRIDHGFGFFTEYRGVLHTSIKEKDKLKKGESLGQAGREFEYIVQIADTWVDPLYFAVMR